MDFCGFSLAELTRETSNLLWELYNKYPNFQKFMQFPSYCTFRDAGYIYSEISVDCGETKGVLLPTQEGILKNFVIKIPFLHRFCDYEGTKRIYKDEIDYCRCEARNFILAKREGLDSLFAPCIKIFDFDWGYGETPVYLMRRVSIDEDEAFNRSFSVYRQGYCSEYPKTVNQSDDEYEDEMYDSFTEEDETDSFFSTVGAEYTTDLALKLEDFCDRNCINDIHRANIGFDDDGNIIIIDYSGYGEIAHEAVNDNWWDIGEDI